MSESSERATGAPGDMQLQSTQLSASVLDALTSQICVIDRDGLIVAVNRAWKKFGAENASQPCHSDIGTNYVAICKNARGLGAVEADDFAKGVRAVLEGETDLFQMEYPCHSPAKSRWFLGRVSERVNDFETPFVMRLASGFD